MFILLMVVMPSNAEGSSTSDSEDDAIHESMSASCQCSVPIDASTREERTEIESYCAEWADPIQEEVNMEWEQPLLADDFIGVSVNDTLLDISDALWVPTYYDDPTDGTFLDGSQEGNGPILRQEFLVGVPALPISDSDSWVAPFLNELLHQIGDTVPVVLEQSWDLPHGQELLATPLPYMVAVGIHTGSELSVFSRLCDLVSRFWHSFAGPVLARLRREKILQNPVRARLYSEIETNPGIWYRELIRRLGISNGQVSFHLHRLETSGLVRSAKVRGRRRLMTNDSGEKVEPMVMSFRQRSILDFLSKNGGASQRGLSEELNMGRSTVSYNLRVLNSLGLVEVVRQGRRNLYRTTRSPNAP